MFVALVVAVPIVLLLIWGVVFDFKQRRRNEPLTKYDARASQRGQETRLKARAPSGEGAAGAASDRQEHRR